MSSSRRKVRVLPLLALSLLSWGIVIFFLLFVDPEVVRNFPIANSYLPFFTFVFLSLFLTFSILFLNIRRAIILSLGIIVFLYLCLFGLGHLLNLLLLAALVVVLELALISKS